MAEQSLDEYFSSVEYTCPSPVVYQISIKDRKLHGVDISSFHIVNSKYFLFLFINDSFPLFKIELQQKIQIKEYHLDLTEDLMTLIIIKYDLKEKIDKFIKKKTYLSFTKRVLNKIYHNYYSTNFIAYYINSLKKKSLQGLQLYYLMKIKKKFKIHKLNENIKNIYEKVFFDKTKNAIISRRIYENNRKAYIIKYFFGKIGLMQKNKLLLANLTEKIINIYIRKRITFFFQVIKANSESVTKIEQIVEAYHIHKLFDKIFYGIKANYVKQKSIKEKIANYNKYNFLFIEILVEQLGYKDYLKKISQENISKVFILLKHNLLQKKLIYSKFAIISSKFLKNKKEKIFQFYRGGEKYKKENKKKVYESFFKKTSQIIFNKKLLHNRNLIMKYTNKQNVYQTFFGNIATNLSNKLYRMRLKAEWSKKVMVYKLYEFFSCLFLSKKLNEKKICQNVTSSFEFVSIRLLQKKKKQLIKNLSNINIFKYFIKQIKFSKKETQLKRNATEIKYDKQKYFYWVFLNRIKTENSLHKRQKYFKNKHLKECFQKYKQQVKEKNWMTGASQSYNEKIKHKSMVVLYHYSFFKKEKNIRDEYFSYHLQKLLLKVYYNQYIKQSFALRNQIKVIELITKKNGIHNFFKLSKKNCKKKKIFKKIKNSLKKTVLIKMIEISNKNTKIKQSKQHFNKRSANFTFYNMFLYKILSHTHREKNIKQAINCMNLQKIFTHFKKVLYEVKKKYFLLEKFYYSNFINHLCYKKQTKEDTKNQIIKFKKSLPFLYLRKRITEKQKTTFIQTNYLKFIITKKIVPLVKIVKLFNALKPILFLKKTIWSIILLRLLTLNKQNIIFKQKRQRIYLTQIKKMIIKKKKTKSSFEKMKILFNKKHILKNLMIVVLQKIKNEIIRNNSKKYIFKKFVTQSIKLYQYKHSQKIIQKKQLISDQLQYILNKNRLNSYYCFLVHVGSKVKTKNINSRVDFINHQKRINDISLFFQNINCLKNKSYITKMTYIKEMRFFFNMVKQKKNLKKFKKKYCLYKNFKNFQLNCLNYSKNKQTTSKLITFYGIKSIKQFKSQIKLIKSESSVNAKLFKQIKTSIKILLQKKKEKIFKMFIDTTKMLYKINKKLKKSIFKMLKENMIISKDINYYLNEAKDYK